MYDGKVFFEVIAATKKFEHSSPGYITPEIQTWLRLKVNLMRKKKQLLGGKVLKFAQLKDLDFDLFRIYSSTLYIFSILGLKKFPF